MRKVVCATRGGEGSRAAQLAAIALAKEWQASLTFLFVVDPYSLAGVDASLETAVSNELHWMGQTLLQIAQNRARAAGLETNMVIRHGPIAAEINSYLREINADKLILGASRGTTINTFGDDAMEQFAASLEQQTGITVQLVRPEAYPISNPQSSNTPFRSSL